MISNLAQGVRAFTSNVFYVAGERPVIVDPGANFDVLDRLENRPAPDAIVVTHTHPDHVGNLQAVKDAYGIEAWGYDTSDDGIDHAIENGDTLKLGDHTYRALFTPGHHPGHLCFYAPGQEILFAGDLVFQNGGFGRTDLDGADRQTLIESIEYLANEIDETLAEMHVGHGPSVTQEPYGHIELALRSARMSA